MIESIAIENFKSIVGDEIQLRPLTVLVGANGSGKSNLVKALEFLATIPSIGLRDAVSGCGGFEAIVPKAIPRNAVRKTRISFRYRALLPRPKGYPEHLPPVAVDHELTISHSQREIVRIVGEKLTFHQALAVARVRAAESEEEQIEESLLAQPSRFVLERGSRGGVKWWAEPAIAGAVPLYLEWLGLPMLKDTVTSVAFLRRVLNIVGRGAERPRYQSFLDPGVRSVVAFGAQATLFRDLLRSVRRYDLLLGELRPAQKAGSHRGLSSVGDNMPSVVRYLSSRSDPDAWDRVLGTMGSVAPHVASMQTNSLRTGNQFVEFVESKVGRGVESWETSDGTLRALAILLALETHLGWSTVLIEEPEQNLHPWAVRAIVDHIREVIAVRDLQVILTTHSEQVLERVYPEEVLVATRSEREGTKFRTLQEILPQSKINMGEVAELWVKGLLGGVPSHE